uniref:Neur_chan_LBD domain-containing protein n=1 Tax=Heterorhabditis bacteriophora TaxID=37862 RepID=A0A1I7WNQ9_HETBA
MQYSVFYTEVNCSDGIAIWMPMVNMVFIDTIVYFAPCFANGKLVFGALKLTVIVMNPTHENYPAILHRIQVWSVRGPVQSFYVTDLQPSLGASNGVDTGIVLLESESNAWKSLDIRD